MRETVYKYPIMGSIENDGNGDYFDISLPPDAVPLCVQCQYGEPQMWVRLRSELVDNYVRPVRFYICGTGHTLHPNAGKHLDTFQVKDGSLVFHIFEGKQ